MKINNYRDLRVWQLSMEAAFVVREAALTFPKHEMFGLVSQIQRAAVSMPTNIAEGHERDSTKEFLRFLSIAQGSRAELETELMLAQRSRYLTAQQTEQFLAQLEEIGKMLSAMQKTLRRKLEEGNRD